MSRLDDAPDSTAAARAPEDPAWLGRLRAAFPAEGFFAEKEWLLSPEPFRLSKAEAAELSRLGHRLARFVRACHEIYRRSAKGTAPGWVADYLDAGKPRWLIEAARSPALAGAFPQVIRPDLILGENGFSITELDSVPGGIGLTAWLNQTYADMGFDVIGGAGGMHDGFQSLLPSGGDILVSEESAGYRPEMAWLARQLGGIDVLPAENYAPRGRDAYRFFELFDLGNIPGAKALVEAAAAGEIRLTAPPKPYLEEKMWSALFWMHPLRDLWAAGLRGSHLARLRDAFPYSWIIDPAPVPRHAEIPRLGIQDWRELGAMSKTERELVLKISGFSETAWGSRSVSVGHDLPAPDWAAAVDDAIAAFPDHPFVLQEFRPARVVEHPYWDAEAKQVRTMQARVRLCPYFFADPALAKTNLGGVLATICPADKKILHGMKDAILVPCMVEA
ncbi:MAG: hypothetical protein R3F11_13150 [Verrucomicrobiales bacterium]